MHKMLLVTFAVGTLFLAANASSWNKPWFPRTTNTKSEFFALEGQGEMCILGKNMSNYINNLEDKYPPLKPDDYVVIKNGPGVDKMWTLKENYHQIQVRLVSRTKETGTIEIRVNNQKNSRQYKNVPISNLCQVETYKEARVQYKEFIDEEKLAVNTQLQSCRKNKNSYNHDWEPFMKIFVHQKLTQYMENMQSLYFIKNQWPDSETFEDAAQHAAELRKLLLKRLKDPKLDLEEPENLLSLLEKWKESEMNPLGVEGVTDALAQQLKDNYNFDPYPYSREMNTCSCSYHTEVRKMVTEMYYQEYEELQQKKKSSEKAATISQ